MFPTKIHVIVMLVFTIQQIKARMNTTIDKFSHEKHLVKDIETLYKQLGTTSRPVKNSSNPVYVKFGLRLITLDVDEKLQILTISAWARYMWYDEYIGWERDDYGGISHVIVPPGTIWMPEDISLVNTAEADLDVRQVYAQIKHTGRIFYAPHVIYKAGCLINLSNYPYDVQTCILWIQSSSRFSWDLQLVPYKPQFDLDTYLGSFKSGSEWDVSGNSSVYIDNPREHGAILMYSRRAALKFSLTLRRRVGFMSILLMLPCIFLSLLIPVIFTLPTERPDRHMLAMSLFASFMVLLLILTANAPPSAASVPSLGKYYCFIMFTIISAIFVSVFIIFVSRRAETKRYPPKWAQTLFLRYIAVILCLRDRAKHLHSSPPPISSDSENKQYSSMQLKQPKQPPTPSLYPNPDAMSSNDEDENVTSLRAEINRLNSVIKKNKNSGPKPPSVAQQQWKLITLILDRLAAVLYFVIIVIAMVLLLPKPTSEWLE